MAAKPARLERAGALTDRDRIWAAIRALGAARGGPKLENFSPAEVMALAGTERELTEDYFRGLAAAQPPYLNLVNANRPAGPRGKWECFHFALVRDTGVEAPRVTEDGREYTAGLGTQRMWDWLRVAKEFDCVELAHGASDEKLELSGSTAKNYAHALELAGYLVCAARARRCGRNPGVLARYRFLPSRNTGPRAPSIGRDKAVIDNNLGKTVWTRTGGKKWPGQT